MHRDNGEKLERRWKKAKELHLPIRTCSECGEKYIKTRGVWQDECLPCLLKLDPQLFELTYPGIVFSSLRTSQPQIEQLIQQDIQPIIGGDGAGGGG